ncbi:MAG TPA: hypothetical protein VFK02_11095 [Kofleriaceae bacterium]|nr:hypothetical protein [Kofleriaceae bacterium]
MSTLGEARGARWILAGVLIAGAGAGTGCTASAEDVRPRADQLFFPSGVALAPDDSVLFVANANSELRYDSGSISVINLGMVESIIQAWSTGNAAEGCEPDAAHRETLVCEVAPFMRLTSMGQPAGVRIGNFSTDIGVEDFSPRDATGKVTSVNLRLFVPTRGDPSIAWADYNGDRLSCTVKNDPFALCDDAHRLEVPDEDPLAALIPDEPFNAFADADGGFAVVTHLTNGAVTLIDSPRGEDALISDVRHNVFLPDPSTGLRGATGVTGRHLPVDGSSATPETVVYVGSRTDSRIQTFTVGRPPNFAPPYLLPDNFFFLNSVGTNQGIGSSVDTRGMKFSDDGNRLYVVNRRPPSLQIYDTSIGPDGFPLNRAIGASDICPAASTLAVVDNGDGERAYVTCFQDGQVYVIDPRGESRLEDVLTVGRGPFGIVASPRLQQLFITNFLEDTIAVVDVKSGSPTQNRVVLRIGIPRES